MTKLQFHAWIKRLQIALGGDEFIATTFLHANTDFTPATERQAKDPVQLMDGHTADIRLLLETVVDIARSAT